MIRKIYLVHHTHMDIGYTDLPGEVMRFQRNYLDQALCLCEKDPDFRWTIESSRLLKDYILHRPETDVQRMKAALQRGQMELMALDCQPLMELCSTPEQQHICAWAAELAQKWDFPVECAMLDDIGGWPATLPDFCRPHGVKYLVAGVGAYQVFLPWEKDLPHLFRLRSPGGKTITVWNLGTDRTMDPRKDATSLKAVYGLGTGCIINPWKNQFLLGQAGQVEAESIAEEIDTHPEEVFAELAARLEAEHYPYEEVMIQYGGDNCGPDPVLPDLIRRINATGKMPEIKLTTPSVFLRLMEERYGESIPEFTGLLADPWMTRCNPAPVFLKSYRNAQRQFCTALKLQSMLPDEENAEKLSETADLLALCSDHTGGLSVWFEPDVRKPGENIKLGRYLRMRESWNRKRFYADHAADHAAEVVSSTAGRLFASAGKTPAAGVFNPAAGNQDGYITLYTGRNGGILAQLKDDAGNMIPFEYTGYHRYFCKVPDLKGQEIRLLYDTRAADQGRWCLPQDEYQPMPRKWCNSFFMMDFDEDHSVKSIRLQQTGECVYDRETAQFPFLEPVLELPVDFQLEWAKAGMAPLEKVEYPQPQYQEGGLLFSGALTDVIERKGCFPGRFDFVLRWRLYHDIPQIDVELEIAKEENASLESIYLACPLHGKAQKWLLHTADSSVDPATGLLPGSMQDCFCAHRGISCLAGKNWWTFYSPDVPVTHIGSPRHFRWEWKRDFNRLNAAFFPQIYHNCLLTDSPAFQKINELFRFSLRMDCRQPVEPVELILF